MQVVVLIGFVLAMAMGASPMLEALLPARPVTALALAAYLAGAMILGQASAWTGLRQVRAAERAPLRAVRRHGWMAAAERFWLIGGFAGVLIYGYARWVMEDLPLGELPLLGKLMLVAPFLVVLLGSWVLAYPFYRASRSRLAALQAGIGMPPLSVQTLRQYISFNVRTHLLFIAVPVSMIIAVQDVLLLYVAPLLPEAAVDYVIVAAMVTFAGLTFTLAPVLVVRIWRTKPLADGPLRHELEALCEGLKLRYRQILVWHSHGALANAGVMGLLAPVRYILLTDTLLQRMPPNQIKAVFAHEAGHIVSHHIFYSALFALTVALWVNVLEGVLLAAAPERVIATELVALGLLAVMWVTGFGWLSRRFERQSDVMAAWAAGREDFGPEANKLRPTGQTDGDQDRITPEGAAVYSHALEMVAQLNGASLRQFNWRHGSIADRIRYVLSLAAGGCTRQPIDRFIRRIKLALWAALLAGIALNALAIAGNAS